MKILILIVSLFSIVIGLILALDKKGTFRKLFPSGLFSEPGKEFMQMEESRFWRIIEETLKFSDQDPAGQKELLKNRLTNLPVEEIILFDNRFQSFMIELYKWDYWGVAAILIRDCDAGCFADFRSWVISRGRKYYYSFKEDPQKVNYDESPRLADFQLCASEAYREVTGNRLINNTPSPPGPKGEEWDEEELPGLFPELYQKIRG